MSYIQRKTAFLLSILIIVVGIAVIGFATFKLREFSIAGIVESEQLAFSRAAYILGDRVRSYVHGLQGMNGVYLTNDFRPSPQQLTKYATYRDNFKNFEGALGFGFIRRVRAEDLPSYLRSRRQMDPRLNFRRLSEKHYDNYYIIETIEPYDKNEPALGLDVGSETARRNAAELAMVTGQNAITAPIKLVQSQTAEAGFLSFLPLYRDLSTVPALVRSKSQDLVGWAYVPFTVEGLIKQVRQSFDDRLVFELHDADAGEIYKMNARLDSRFSDPKNWYVEELVVGQRRWRFRGAFTPHPLISILNFLGLAGFVFLSMVHIVWVINYFRLKLSKDETTKKSDEILSWQQAVLDGSAYSIISTDTTGVITTFNKSATRILGYRAEEMVGRKTPGVFHDPVEVTEYAAVLSRELGRTIAPGFEAFVAKTRDHDSDTRNWTYIGKDGTRTQVRLCVTAIRDPSKAIIGYLGVAEDLTQVIKLENEINEQRLKMIAASKMSALGEMAAGVAHEINNPLAIIVSWASMLREGIKAQKPNLEQMSDGIDRIEKTAHRIGKIIAGLRSFSRDSSTDSMVDCSAEKIISETLELCSERFKERGISISVTGDLHASLMCRPVEISQVLMNLLGNAHDAISNLPQKWVKIAVREMTDSTIFSVTDSGAGIPDTMKEKIMQPFFTTKEVGKGTGLGLSISKGIIDSHRGRLVYELVDGHTQFSFTIPKKRKQSA